VREARQSAVEGPLQCGKLQGSLRAFLCDVALRLLISWHPSTASKRARPSCHDRAPAERGRWPGSPPPARASSLIIEDLTRRHLRHATGSHDEAYQAASSAQMRTTMTMTIPIWRARLARSVTVLQRLFPTRPASLSTQPAVARCGLLFPARPGGR